jgi:hypothetical protein
VRFYLAYSTFMLLPWVALGQARDEHGSSRDVYYLQDQANHQWCAYKDRDDWKSAVQLLTARTAGGLVYSGGRLATVHVSQTDESGDWAVFDAYSVDPSRKIGEIIRRINIIPDRTSETQVFVVRNGRAVKQSSIVVDLETRKPGPKPVQWLRPDPVVTRIEAFPFAALIGKHKEIWAVGKVCVADSGSRR